MAQFFGGRSRYIIVMERVSHFAMVAMWFFLAWLAYNYIGQIFQYKSAPIVSVVTLTILYIPVAYWVFREKRKYKKERDAYKQGGKGEGFIYYELLKLPDSYFVFQGVNLPEREGNIDFVVVGHTGIFVIEVKSHRGLIGFNGEELLKDGKVITEKDFIKQTMGGALDLQKYLKQKVGKDFFINPVLVFSHASVKFGFKLIKNIYIIGKSYLNELILTEKRTMLSEEEILILKNELNKLVKKHSNFKSKKMSKKPIRYIRYCYCATCKKEFILSGNNKKRCLYCKGKDNFVVLSEKKETMGEIDEALKKIISLLKKATQKDYLASDFEKSEKEELEKLKCLKEAEDFFKKNPNPKKEELDKIFAKVSQIIKN